MDRQGMDRVAEKPGSREKRPKRCGRMWGGAGERREKGLGREPQSKSKSEVTCRKKHQGTGVAGEAKNPRSNMSPNVMEGTDRM